MILCEPKIPKVRRDPYERSLAELRLFPDRNNLASMNPVGYARLGNFFLQVLQCNIFSTNLNPSHLLHLTGQLGQIGVGAWRFVNDLKRDPYTATMTAFSKISDYLR